MLEKLFLCHHKHRLGAAADLFSFFLLFFLKHVRFSLVKPIIIVSVSACMDVCAWMRAC